MIAIVHTKGRLNEVICFSTILCTEHQLASTDSQYISWCKNKYLLTLFYQLFDAETAKYSVLEETTNGI